VGKHGRRWPLGRPRHRWENNIENYLKENVWKNLDWINLALDGEKKWVVKSTAVECGELLD
jgi:hypothetical protein